MVDKIVKITYVFDSKGHPTAIRQIEELNKGWGKQHKTINVYNGTLDATQKQMIKHGAKITDVAGRMKKWNKEQETSIKGAKMFKMEYLGVLFGGMQLANTFGQMTQGAIEWMGIGELFQNSLNLIALEGLMPMADGIYGIINGLYELPQSAKQSLGELMLWGQGTGIVMQTVGQMVLMLSSLAMAFPAAAGAAGVGIGLLMSKAGSALSKSSDETLKTIGNIMNDVGELVALGGAAQTVYSAAGAIQKVSVLFEEDPMHPASGVLSKVPDSVITTVSLVAGAFIVHEGIQYSYTAFANYVASMIDEKTKVAMKPIMLQFGFGNIQSIVDALERITINPMGITIGGTVEVLRSLATITTNALTKSNTSSYTSLPSNYNPFTGNAYGAGPLVPHQYGGIVEGSIGEPVPILAHGGERVIPANSSGSGSVVVSPTYNIYVSDRREIEDMLRRNNENLVNEVKRMGFGS